MASEEWQNCAINLIALAQLFRDGMQSLAAEPEKSSSGSVPALENCGFFASFVVLYAGLLRPSLAGSTPLRLCLDPSSPPRPSLQLRE